MIESETTVGFRIDRMIDHSVAHNLPRQATSFIGRQSEIAHIVARLDDPACQLLTLVGPGGIGKTRLALEVARYKLAHFPDGAWFVSLAPLTAPDQMAAAIGKALHLQSGGSLTPQEELLHYLSNKRLLLMLDNFEHLLDGAAIVADVLTAAPDVKVLVTSRATLNLRAEWVQPVGGMAYPGEAARDDLDAFSAVQLFAERACQVQPGFSLGQTTEGVIRICQLVAGVPLAIELAAAWLKVMPCEAIVEQIQGEIDFLASNLRDVPERHRSMRAVFDHSWNLLSAQEQQVLQHFCVFRGGCTREAARHVTGATLPQLVSLVQKSLLSVDSAGRYQMHELLRQYAEERLAAVGEQEAVGDAHSAYYAHFLAEREVHLWDHHQEVTLDEIEPDFENVRAAWLRMLDRRDFDQIDQALAALDRFCQLRIQLSEGLPLFEQAWEKLAPLGDELPHRVWGRVLLRPSFDIDYEPDVLEQATRRRERALAILQRYDDPMEIAIGLHWLGHTTNMLHDHHQAMAYLEESLDRFNALGAHYYRAKTLDELGICHTLMGQEDQAIAYLQQALALREAIGDRSGIGWCLYDLGRAYHQLGAVEQAQQTWQASLKHFEATGTLYGIASLHLTLGDLMLLTGEVAQTQEHLRAAETILARHYDPLWFRWLRCQQAVIAGLTGDYPRCQAICNDLSSPGVDSWFRDDDRSLGLVIAACGLADWEAAAKHLTRWLAGSLHVGYADDRTWKRYCVPLAAIIVAHQGEPEWAVELLGCTFAQPPPLTGWLKRWALFNVVYDDLEARLGEAAFTAAWERGQKLSIDEAIARLRGRFLVEADAQQQANLALDEPLTPRELDVLNLIYAGRSNREIADQLVLAESTVKRHINHLYGKLAVESRTQALARARDLGLLM